MIHTFFYQTCVSGEYEGTFRRSASPLPHIPTSVFDKGAPITGWEVVDVRYDLDKSECHIVLEPRRMEGIEEVTITNVMYAAGWRHAPWDPRFCTEAER